MTAYKDIYSVVVFAVLVHAALTASLVNMFMTLSYVKRDAPLRYGGPVDHIKVIAGKGVAGNVQSNVSLEKYEASTTLDGKDEMDVQSNKPETFRYVMW